MLHVFIYSILFLTPMFTTLQKVYACLCECMYMYVWVWNLSFEHQSNLKPWCMYSPTAVQIFFVEETEHWIATALIRGEILLFDSCFNGKLLPSAELQITQMYRPLIASNADYSAAEEWKQQLWTNCHSCCLPGCQGRRPREFNFGWRQTEESSS